MSLTLSLIATYAIFFWAVRALVHAAERPE